MSQQPVTLYFEEIPAVDEAPNTASPEASSSGVEHSNVVTGDTIEAVEASRGEQFVDVDLAGAAVPAGDGDASVQAWRKAKWAQVKRAENVVWPEARGGHTLTSVGERVFLVGGSSRAAEFFAGVWVFDLETLVWSEVEVCGDGERPVARSGHSAVAWGDEIVVYGGQRVELPSMEMRFFDDVWAFHTEKRTWRKVVPADGSMAPPARNAHQAVVLPLLKRMVVIGGSDQEGPHADVLALNLETHEWRTLEPSDGTFTAREMHAACVSESGRVFVSGGRGLADVLSDVLELHLDGDSCSWTKLGEAYPFCGHSLLWSGAALGIFGGLGAAGISQSLLVCDSKSGDASSESWLPAVVSGVEPSHRFAHAVATTSRRMVLFGGLDQSEDKQDTFVLAWPSGQ